MPTPKGIGRKRAADPTYVTVRAAPSPLREHMRRVDAHLAEIKANLAPDQPSEWEIRKAIRDERDALRIKVRELEKQMDELIDSMTRSELTSTPSAIKPRRGRPKKKG